MSAKTGDKGKHSPPGAGNIYAKANEVIVKITGDDTAQTFEVVEENCKPGFQSRAHYHIKAYETFYVFDGSADFQVGDELFHAQKGSCVHIPPGVPHQVTSKDGVRMLMIYSPAGTEGMFAAMHALSPGAIDECRADKKTRAQARHGDDRAEQRWPRQRNDPWLTDCWRTPYLILRLINSDSMDLPWRPAVVRFPTGHPSSALPDTDGRHDRTGYGTWMLLAVFVARDDRPWLSVTGTCASGFGLVVSGMDPRACDGWTTVCPLWLLRGPLHREPVRGLRHQISSPRAPRRRRRRDSER